MAIWYQDTDYNDRTYATTDSLSGYEACSVFTVYANVPTSFGKFALSTLYQAANRCDIYDAKGCTGNHFHLESAADDRFGNEVYHYFNDLLVSHSCYL